MTYEEKGCSAPQKIVLSSAQKCIKKSYRIRKR
jgi:hypothetical protein